MWHWRGGDLCEGRPGAAECDRDGGGGGRYRARLDTGRPVAVAAAEGLSLAAPVRLSPRTAGLQMFGVNLPAILQLGYSNT